MPMTLEIHNVSQPGTLQFRLAYGEDRWEEANSTASLTVNIKHTNNLAPLTVALNSLPAKFGIRAETTLTATHHDHAQAVCKVRLQHTAIFLKILASDFLFKVTHKDTQITLGEPHAPHCYSQLIGHAERLEEVTVAPLSSLTVDESDEDEMYLDYKNDSNHSIHFEIEEESLQKPAASTPQSPLLNHHLFRPVSPVSASLSQDETEFCETEYPFFEASSPRWRK